MMTGITIAKETRLFLLSLAVGAGMSFLYDLLRVLRRRTAHRAAAVSLEDILYFLLCALLHFAFVLKDNRGQLRGYIMVGELLGWVGWHLSAGAVLVEAGSRLLGIVQRVVAGILRVLLFPLYCLYRLMRRVSAALSKVLEKILKKVIQKGKYTLKRKRLMLYNLIGRFKRVNQKRGDCDGIEKETAE